MAVLSGGKQTGKAGGTNKSSGGKPSGGKTPKSKAAGATSKPKPQPIKAGKTSPGKMKVKPPTPVKSKGDHSSNKGHAFGYFRMGIEERK